MTVVVVGPTRVGKGTFIQTAASVFDNTLLDLVCHTTISCAKLPSPNPFPVHVKLPSGVVTTYLTDTIGGGDSFGKDCPSMMQLIDMLNLQQNRIVKVIVLYDTLSASNVEWIKLYITTFGVDNLVFVHRQRRDKEYCVGDTCTTLAKQELRNLVPEVSLKCTQYSLFDFRKGDTNEEREYTIEVTKILEKTAASVVGQTVATSGFTLPESFLRSDVTYGPWQHGTGTTNHHTYSSTKTEEYPCTRDIPNCHWDAYGGTWCIGPHRCSIWNSATCCDQRPTSCKEPSTCTKIVTKTFFETTSCGGLARVSC
eukprot:TRINITY_DN3565_c0_g3_i1.p1 TRINITY_DN3565_c0_g3~~TRINITY_DN3565_c0_g3_i1.p1  ORF type:complete len:339 (-),score=78.23 TRINITY_DN3565_c0_g3_i1:103-1035(-)